MSSRPAVIAITPNPAVDVTITVDELVDEATHRIDQARRRLGGKGVNVAAVAAAQDYPAFMLGPVSETSLAALKERDNSIPAAAELAFSATPVPLRETWAIHRTGDNATVIINEKGAEHPAEVFADVAAKIKDLLAQHPGSVVTISGSWPPGTDNDTLDLLLEAARSNGAGAVIVDCAGSHLLHACRQGAIVKPNLQEIIDTTGITDPHEAAQKLLDEGARLVVVSMGPDGLLAVDSTGARSAKLPTPLKGNPTGCGDALVSALATSVIDELDLSDMLVRLVAWSAAAVLVPYAGAIDDSWPELATQVELS